mmetsp:Transcript_403/g.850  ORF Transcript_403/g.850 Transcript_403/m.850 type:complete len:272 (+) Transcript_403:615-1430(+)
MIVICKHVVGEKSITVNKKLRGAVAVFEFFESGPSIVISGSPVNIVGRFAFRSLTARFASATATGGITPNALATTTTSIAANALGTRDRSREFLALLRTDRLDRRKGLWFIRSGASKPCFLQLVHGHLVVQTSLSRCSATGFDRNCRNGTTRSYWPNLPDHVSGFGGGCNSVWNISYRPSQSIACKASREQRWRSVVALRIHFVIIFFFRNRLPCHDCRTTQFTHYGYIVGVTRANLGIIVVIDVKYIVKRGWCRFRGFRRGTLFLCSQAC